MMDYIFTNNIVTNYKKNILNRTICDHQMTYCILPNHNAENQVNRAYIEVENINEKDTWTT